MKHICKNCNYVTTILSKYLRHIQTDKHKQKIETIKKEEDTIKIIQTMETNVINNINKVKNKLEKQIIKTADKNNKKITAKIEEVKKIATKNKEYAKSTLTILNELYKDNPPLEYPGDRECLTALYEYYKLSRHQVITSNKLQKALIKDYTNGTLLDTIIKILSTFLKKDNLHLQSIFNTDTTRHHYAAKYSNSWEKDKHGIYLSEKVIQPFCEIIKVLMLNYKQYKNDRAKEYKKKLLNKESFTDDEIFERKDEDTEFIYKDDTSDEDKRGIEELEELLQINKLRRYIESGCMYDEIIARLSLILNFCVRIKKC
jgi:hypothetical protein